jgi:hypothetical protein
MAKFWELLEDSVIIQALLTLGVWTAIIVLVCLGRSIPEILSAGGYTILGFWFGSKAAALVTRTAAAMRIPPA